MNDGKAFRLPRQQGSRGVTLTELARLWTAEELALARQRTSALRREVSYREMILDFEEKRRKAEGPAAALPDDKTNAQKRGDPIPKG